MTITIKKLHLAIAVMAVAALVPATAFATHVFTDVDDGRFYAEPVEWAAANEITTGTSETTFDPDRPVTRGESVTFLKRYHDAFGSQPVTRTDTVIEIDSSLAPGEYAGACPSDAPVPVNGTIYFVDEQVAWTSSPDDGGRPAWSLDGPFGASIGQPVKFSVNDAVPAGLSKTIVLIQFCTTAPVPG